MCSNDKSRAISVVEKLSEERILTSEGQGKESVIRGENSGNQMVSSSGEHKVFLGGSEFVSEYCEAGGQCGLDQHTDPFPVCVSEDSDLNLLLFSLKS